MKKRIIVDREVKEFMAKAFGCTIRNIEHALTFTRNGATAQRMRVLALQKGGVMIGGEDVEPETEHDTANGMMTQRFGSHVQMHVDMKSSVITVMINSEKDSEYHNLTIPEFMRLQADLKLRAAAL